MGSFSIMHWAIILIIVVFVFGGRGKISSLMGDLGKGINSFKLALKEDEIRGREEERTSISTDRAYGVEASNTGIGRQQNKTPNDKSRNEELGLERD